MVNVGLFVQTNRPPSRPDGRSTINSGGVESVVSGHLIIHIAPSRKRALIIEGEGPSREANMVLIPVVLVIGGILALVYWLDKRSPWPK